MNILIVCSGNFENFSFEKHQPFIYEQVNSIKKINKQINFKFFFINGKGIFGYLRNYSRLKKEIFENKIDIIHSHFALSSLLANIQNRVPVITTFHGSDINLFKNRLFSFLAACLSKKNIYVSKELYNRALIKLKKKSIVLPCGVDFSIFYPKDKTKAREIMSLNAKKIYILFSSAFNNKIKNYELLKDALSQITEMEITPIELLNYSRIDVANLMNAVDICVLTSFSEGSPQFIKEAMACSCPIISTDVGDVKDIISGIQGCEIVSYNNKELANKILEIIHRDCRTNGHLHLNNYNISSIALDLINIYKSIK